MNLRESLRRTRQAVFGQIVTWLGTSEVSDATWNELEALLIQADLGVEIALEVIQALQRRVRTEGLTTHNQLLSALRDELRAFLPSPRSPLLDSQRPLTVVLIVGANGSGKTTTIAKLAQRFSSQGRRVMLAAADTFRAAAIEQLRTWGERVGVPVIAAQAGSDAGAVVYDAISAARARGYDLLFIDTAGRLHTKYNLMEELKKVRGVTAKNVQAAPHEVWLVLDATTGQNALSQALHFKQAVGVTGLIIAKLDSTAKGGMIFAIGKTLGLPVCYLGIGEGLDDLIPFDPDQFVEALVTPTEV